MQSDYHIEDLVYQDGERVIYRTRTIDGAFYAIIRLKFNSDDLTILGDGCFERAYQELLALEHISLRPIVDGGLDPIDGFPWVAVRWWDGPRLDERLEIAPLTSEETARLESHGAALIAFLGNRSGALSFNPHDIITTQSADGQPVDTFSLDFWGWFNDRVESRAPGTSKNALLSLHSLIKKLRPPETAPILQPTIPKAAVFTPTPLATVPSRKTYLPPPKASPLKPILVCFTLLALICGGVWWGLQRRAKIIAEEALEKSPASLRTKTTPDKLKPSTPVGNFYTLADEAELTEMIGQTVTLQAKAIDFDQSQSGKSLYLIFHNNRAGFRAGVRFSESEKGIDESFVRSFVGKTINVTGLLTQETAGGDLGMRLVLRFKRKSHLQIVE